MLRSLSFACLSLFALGARAEDCPATDDVGRIKIIARVSYALHVKMGHEYDLDKVIAEQKYAGPIFAKPADFEAYLMDLYKGGKAEVRHLDNDQTAYWDAATGTVLKINPKTRNCGVAHRPARGYLNFQMLR